MNQTPWKYIIFNIFIGLMLVCGYFSTAGLHFQAIDFQIDSKKSKASYEKLKEEERRLTLIAEISRAEALFNKIKLNNLIEEQLSEIKNKVQSINIESNYKMLMADQYQEQARTQLFYVFVASILLIIISGIIGNLNRSLLLGQPISVRFSQISDFLFSGKNQKEVFEPIVADWQEEYFEALSKKEMRKARWINVRYTYAFLAAMWMKSPIGDLIEFVIKIAKP